MCVLTDVTTPGACAGLRCEEPQHVARYAVQRHALPQLSIDVRQHTFHDVGSRGCLPVRIEMLFELGQEVRLVIGLAADHGAIDMLQDVVNFAERRETTIDDDLEPGQVAFQLVYALVI